MSLNDDCPSYYGYSIAQAKALKDDWEDYRYNEQTRSQRYQGYILIAIRLIIWGIFIFLIALDALLGSTSLSAALFFVPWLGVGLFYAVVMDGMATEGKDVQLMLMLIPYLMLSDFVMGF